MKQSSYMFHLLNPEFRLDSLAILVYIHRQGSKRGQILLFSQCIIQGENKKSQLSFAVLFIGHGKKRKSKHKNWYFIKSVQILIPNVLILLKVPKSSYAIAMIEGQIYHKFFFLLFSRYSYRQTSLNIVDHSVLHIFNYNLLVN